MGPKQVTSGETLRRQADTSARGSLVLPDPADPRLTRRLAGLDQNGQPVETNVVIERPLTLFLNSREIVTMMTIGDYPEYLAVGYLLNQNMLRPDDEITGIDYDEELEVVVVRTVRTTDYEDKLAKKVLTSGCAQGTLFGDVMEKFDGIVLDPRRAPAHQLDVWAAEGDQHHAEPLSRRRRHSRLRIVRRRPAVDLHGGRRPAQRRRQDRRLHAPEAAILRATRSSTRPAG